MTKEYLANVDELGWIDSPTLVGGRPITRHQFLIRDGDDGPEGSISTRLVGRTPPHLHPAAQFQLVVSGSSSYPTYEIPAIGVHYTDHCVPYGPFDTTPDYCHYVLHAKPGSQIKMTNKCVRGKTNGTGRDIAASDRNLSWTAMPGYPKARCKSLIEEASGVRAEMIDCPPGTALATGPAPHGRYEVVLQGSVGVDGRELTKHGLRFVIGSQPPRPLLAGPDGVLVILLQYDADADKTYIKEFTYD